MRSFSKLAIRGTLLAQLLMLCAGCARENAKLLPAHVVGFWTTDDARYEGRFLELYRTYVIIGTGPSEVRRVQVIDKVEAEPTGQEVTYTISSTDLDGNPYKLAIRYSPAHGGEICFKNQPNVVWRRRVDKAESQKH